ncbi:hypothetical protein PV729_45425 [Streptomyces europaeiscabiei]|uniref:Uncharacterized protein n=1 Tax=Streptomyces europaeiscabiei TaxID=146819 RepID=A0ABU4NZ04_9ACTN|nr:hypothetical protein [Streptomyces europaeiscabiei]MDX3544344.1 hypothetical protein [Streptomyces europaeiscabiei]MDX3558817.1 hypothetical protein [Streptomyces europaeiscabiei]MDX3707247.1 hypothetical protein [Streptomyces europaeiscabiei]
MPAELTEQQRYDRRLASARAITKALRETHHEWHRLNDGDWRLLGDIAIDALGDLAAEILTDGTMMRALTIRDGVATLELEPATEILKIFVASMRGILDGYGAENYVETEMTAPSVSMDLRDGDNPTDSYTVTIQRRTHPTPHEFRQRAEKQRDGVLQLVADWYASSEGRDVLIEDLAAAGYPLPAPTPAV